MLRRVFAMLVALVAILVIVGFLLPASVSVERSHSMDHSPEIIFEAMSDLRHFVQWSPWLDRHREGFRLEGRASGVGATLIWREAHEVGASRMWITGTEAPRRIDFDLELGEHEASGHFLIESDGLAQRVTWGMTIRFGPIDLAGRYLGLLLPRLVGREYQQGLERLEAYLDSAATGHLPELPEGIRGDRSAFDRHRL